MGVFMFGWRSAISLVIFGTVFEEDCKRSLLFTRRTKGCNCMLLCTLILNHFFVVSFTLHVVWTTVNPFPFSPVCRCRRGNWVPVEVVPASSGCDGEPSQRNRGHIRPSTRSRSGAGAHFLWFRLGLLISALVLHGPWVYKPALLSNWEANRKVATVGENVL